MSEMRIGTQVEWCELPGKRGTVIRHPDRHARRPPWDVDDHEQAAREAAGRIAVRWAASGMVDELDASELVVIA